MKHYIYQENWGSVLVITVILMGFVWLFEKLAT